MSINVCYALYADYMFPLFGITGPSLMISALLLVYF